MARYKFSWGDNVASHPGGAKPIRDQVFLGSRSGEITVSCPSSSVGPMAFLIGVNWPPVFDDNDVITINPGEVFTKQREFSAIRFPTNWGGIVTVEISGPEDLAPIRATIEEEA